MIQIGDYVSAPMQNHPNEIHKGVVVGLVGKALIEVRGPNKHTYRCFRSEAQKVTTPLTIDEYRFQLAVQIELGQRQTPTQRPRPRKPTQDTPEGPAKILQFPKRKRGSFWKKVIGDP